MDEIIRPIWLPDRLTDGHIVLDGHTLADAEAHWRGEDDEMRRRFDWPLMRRVTLEHVQGVMRRWMEARIAGGPMFVCAVRDLAGVLVGGCELRLIDAERANVSYWLYPEHRGRGYAARALALLCDAALRVEGVGRLEAHVAPDNVASRRLAERCGFVETGTIEDEDAAGDFLTHLLYIREVAEAATGRKSSPAAT
jgi:RimJ/RimL family protein N-acetyltransferase